MYTGLQTVIVYELVLRFSFLANLEDLAQAGTDTSDGDEEPTPLGLIIMQPLMAVFKNPNSLCY